MVKTYSQLYLDTRKTLMQANDADYAGFAARQLLCHMTGRTWEQLLADGPLYAPEAVCDQLPFLAVRMLKGEPLAYILGEWEFYGLKLYVNRSVLIPRDDTCAVTDLAITAARTINGKPRILDLCTGSGCIGLAIADRLKNARVTLADISPEALTVAKKNITRNQLSARVSAVTANALETPTAFLGKFDLIVSNPPYITGPEMKELDDSVSKFEPHLALYGGEDGLKFYRAIAENYKNALNPGGYLCFEFGMGQADAVSEILEMNQYTILERSRDYNDRERAIIAQRKDD